MAFVRWMMVFAVAWTLAAGDAGSKVEYVGGTLAVKSSSDGMLDATNATLLRVKLAKTGLAIPYDRINLLEYGQKVSREYIAAALISPMFLLAKKRKHFLTVGFKDENGAQQAMVLRVDKQHIRAVLVTLEARTGQRVTYQDEEARKAGKG